DPLGEHGDVDLGLAVREVRRARRLDARCDRGALGARLLAMPARRLVRGPRRGDRGDRQQQRRRELEPVREAVVHQDATGRPCSLHGSGVRWPTAVRASSISLIVRSIAVGCIWPGPARYGPSSALIAVSVSTITVVADPISI